MLDTITDIAPLLADEDKAREALEALRWPNGPVCPHCTNTQNIYRITPKQGSKTRQGVLKCGKCRKQFTVTVGTVFEGTRIHLGKWIYAMFLMCTAKKGLSANQLKRELGISYKSAWFMCHRIRYAMTESPLAERLGGDGGIVEVDETYIGGKRKNNPHRNHKPTKKAIVVALIDREGKARTFPVPRATKGYLQSLIRMNVQGESHIVTDSHKSYEGIEARFASHGSVDHSKEFVRGVIHTNFAESYFSLLKRGIFGTFHHVSEEHLPKYLREFEFRWNRRDMTVGELTTDAIRGARGKRLTYKAPIKRRGRPSDKAKARAVAKPSQNLT